MRSKRKSDGVQTGVRAIVAATLAVGLLAGCVSGAESGIESAVRMSEGITELAETIVDNLADREFRRVAINNFLTLDGEDTLLGRYIAEQLVVDLISEGSEFEIVERNQLEEALRETQFTVNEILRSPEQIVNIGQFIPADAFVIGTITPFDGYSGLSARMFSVETGRVFSAARVNILNTPEVLSLLGDRAPPQTPAASDSDVAQPIGGATQGAGGSSSGASQQTDVAVPAGSPNLNGRSTWGELSLSSGFSDDPRRVDGRLENISYWEVPDAQFAGYIDGSAPNVVVDYQAGGFPLSFGVESDVDTTLLVYAADQRWYYNDDYAGRNPVVRFDSPASGRYYVWVGSFGSSDVGARAALLVTEFSDFDWPGGSGTEGASSGGGSTPAASPNWQVEPRYGRLNLSSGFTNDPRSVNLTAGGSEEYSSWQVDVRGYFSLAAPDVTLTYDAGSFDLYIYVESSADTVLLIRQPNGRWVGNDDFADGRNPAYRIVEPRSGEYQIWVGTYDGGTASARLSISEVGFYQ